MSMMYGPIFGDHSFFSNKAYQSLKGTHPSSPILNIYGLQEPNIHINFSSGWCSGTCLILDPCWEGKIYTQTLLCFVRGECGGRYHALVRWMLFLQCMLDLFGYPLGYFSSFSDYAPLLLHAREIFGSLIFGEVIIMAMWSLWTHRNCIIVDEGSLSFAWCHMSFVGGMKALTLRVVLSHRSRIESMFGWVVSNVFHLFLLGMRPCKQQIQLFFINKKR